MLKKLFPFAVTPGTFDGSLHFLMPYIQGATYENVEAEQYVGKHVRAGDATWAIFPFELTGVLKNFYDLDRVNELIDENYERGLRTLFVVDNDYAKPFNLHQPKSMIWRESMNRSAAYTAEYLRPSIVIDPYVESQKSFFLKPWQEVPRVGFMGQNSFSSIHKLTTGLFTDSEAMDFAKSIGLSLIDPKLSEKLRPPLTTPFDVGSVIRNRALKGLEASEIIDGEFIRRKMYHGHFDEEVKSANRASYLDHLLNTSYNLCVRGAGNFAIRFYETMAAGRIPIFIDTDSLLPCSDLIDWSDSLVQVPLAKLDNIDKYVVDFHSNLGPQGFADIQKRNRRIYLDYLSGPAFAKYVVDFIQKDSNDIR